MDHRSLVVVAVTTMMLVLHSLTLVSWGDGSCLERCPTRPGSLGSRDVDPDCVLKCLRGEDDADTSRKRPVIIDQTRGALRLKVVRQYQDARCTSGYLAVNDQIIAYTLERPWRNNTPFISSIPVGVYEGFLRYDHPDDRWRIELERVPGRRHVEIHIGNKPRQTEGCLLVGMRLGRDFCSLIDGASAYRQLKTAFYGTDRPTATPNRRIVLTVAESEAR